MSSTEPLAGQPVIAVFGSSEPSPGEPEYERARRVGALLARAGAVIICGGYGGVMEGASRGAAEAGGQAIGITCAAFSGRAPNRYLTRVIEEPDLFARTRRLIEPARGFIILPGKSGTLAELTFLWALRRAGLLPGRPIVLLGEGWEEILKTLVSVRFLEEKASSGTRLAASEEEAVAAALEAC